MGIIVDILSTVLLLLYGALWQNVVLAIIAFTVIVRVGLLPLTLGQQRSMKKMQELSPKLRELQKKYKEDRERLAQEQMALYRENGVNPLAGCLPLLIQLPIIFSLWRAIIATLAASPRQLVDLQDRILIDGLDYLLPMNNTFMWLNLSLPDPYYVLPVLVVITSYVQQKMIMPVQPKTAAKPRKPGEPPDPAEQAQQMTRSMTTFMPLFLGFVSLSYSSGLSIYFVVSNIFGIIQYSAMGKADIRRLFGVEPDKDEEKTPAASSADAVPAMAVMPSEASDDEDEAVVESTARATAKASSTEKQLKPGIAVMTLKPQPAGAKAKGGSGGQRKSSKASRTTNTSSRARRKAKRR